MSAMRYFAVPAFFISIAFAASASLAQQAMPNPVTPTDAVASQSQAERIDTLFAALKRERNADKAKAISAQIWAEWNDSGSATVNLLMQWTNEAIAAKRNAAALDFLDQATILKPNYTEAWNKRATLHYIMGDTRKSMSDINQVLNREPRHFGALGGMAGILAENGQDDLAMKAWERYLEIYPADRDAQEQVSKLAEKIAGSRT
jgi:tetratricopeptide (TPR) repeat protein